MTELVFRAADRAEPELEVRVNFGIFAGRNASQAEIDELARMLREDVPTFAIVAQERHEFGGDREASIRQVVIEIDDETVGLEQRVSKIAERWARTCIRSRSDLGELGSEL